MPPVDVVALGAHPDDVELQMGGTLLALRAKGYRTAIVDLTRGEMGTRGSPDVRAAEAARAAAILGVEERRNLGLPDGKVAADERSKDLVIRALRDLRPSILLAPWFEDLHPDHAAAGRLAKESAFLAGLERWETGQEPHRPAKVVHAMFHTLLEPSFVIDVSAEFERKREAVLAFSSQFYKEGSTERPTFISSPGFFAWWEGRHRFYGQRIGAQFGEAYRIEGPLPVADPVAQFRNTGIYRP